MTSDVEGTPIRLLIVEDYEPLRSLLSRLLSHYPDMLVVGAAAKGQEAIELARAHQPAVVLMDTDIRGIGGVEATRLLVDLLPGVRVIAHSALEDSAAMREAGAVEYVAKGSPPGLLLAAIRRQSSPPERATLATGAVAP